MKNLTNGGITAIQSTLDPLRFEKQQLTLLRSKAKSFALRAESYGR